MRKIINFFNNNKKAIKYCFFILFAFFVVLFGYYKYANHWKAQKIEYVDSTGTYHKQYNEGDFNELKKENKELYDSLKKYKDKIDFLTQFNYDKSYNSGKVVVKTKEVQSPTYVKNKDGQYVEKVEEAKTYEYENEPNDSFNYKLQINSTREPNWYSLNVKLHDKITIVNKDEGNGVNHLTIKTDNKADISNVTTFKKKEKKNIFNKISIAPGVFYGYDFKSKQMGYGVGITIGYNIFGSK